MSTMISDLTELTHDDKSALAALAGRDEQMLARTLNWARTNTGSWNSEGLNAFAPELTRAFSVLDAEVQAIETEPVSKIGVKWRSLDLPIRTGYPHRRAARSRGANRDVRALRHGLSAGHVRTGCGSRRGARWRAGRRRYEGRAGGDARSAQSVPSKPISNTDWAIRSS